MLNRQLLQEGRHYRKTFAALVFLALAAGLLIVLQAHCVTLILTRVFFEQQGLAESRSLFVVLFAVVFSRALLTGGVSYIGQNLALMIKQDIRQRMGAAVLAAGPAAVAATAPGSVAAMMIDGVENLDSYFSRYLPQMISAAVVPFVVLFFIFFVHIYAGLILLGTVVVLPVLMLLIGRLAKQKSLQQWESLSRLSAHFYDIVQGLATLKLFGRSKEQRKIVADMAGRFGDAALQVLRVAFLSAFVLELISTISIAMVSVLAGLRLLYGQLEFYQAFVILLLAPEYYAPIRQLGGYYHAGMAGTTAAEPIYRLLEKSGAAAWRNQAAVFSSAAVEIAFQHVDFVYNEGKWPAVADISFMLQKGKKIALVGCSGSGKSTIAKLLLNFIQPSAGVILANGVPLSSIGHAEWLQNVAYLPQKPHIFAGTVWDNLVMGRRQVSEEQVREAARQANIHEVILQLPQQYDTVIGQGGRRLSGGESQRLAVARAFLHQSALIVLDEPVAALDPYNEELVTAALARLMVGRTVLMIAHRMATAKLADCLLVMREGKIVETGCHAALMKERGAYYELVVSGRGEA